MEPCSILELSSTVIKLGTQLYTFCKAVHNAPADVKEYLEALEDIRNVFSDVRDYAALHESSSFRNVDKLQLDTISTVLRECELTFSLKLSFLENYDIGNDATKLERLRTKIGFVFSKAALKQHTAQLQKSQSLLGQAVSTSIGMNTIFIREEVEAARLDIQKAMSRIDRDEEQRLKCLENIAKYNRTLQDGISIISDFATAAGIRSESRLEDMVTSLDISTLPPTASGQHAHAAVNPDQAQQVQRPIGDASKHGDTNPVPKVESSSGDAGVLKLSSSQIFTESRNQQSEPVPKANASDRSSVEFEEAIAELRVTLSDYQRSFPTHSITQEDVLSSLLPALRNVNQKPVFNKLQHVVHTFSNSVDIFLQTQPEVANVFWGALKILVETATKEREFYQGIASSLEEMADAVSASERELQLYNDKKLSRLVADAYRQLFHHARLCTDFATKRRAVINTAITGSMRQRLQDSISEMRRISKKIIREVDYQHRLEMREASLKIAEMHVEQQRICRMLHDQRIILQSMKQERVLLDGVREQQKILQIVQMIQYDLQTQTRPSSADTR